MEPIAYEKVPQSLLEDDDCDVDKCKGCEIEKLQDFIDKYITVGSNVRLFVCGGCIKIIATEHRNTPSYYCKGCDEYYCNDCYSKYLSNTSNKGIRSMSSHNSRCIECKSKK